MDLTEIDTAIEQARDLLREASGGLALYWQVAQRGDDMWELWNQIGGVAGSVDRILGEFRGAVKRGTNQ